MSALQQRQDEIHIRGTKQPTDADQRDRRAGGDAQHQGAPPGGSLIRDVRLLLRVIALAAMVAVLVTGAWKSHPLPSLLLPIAAGLVWWRTGYRYRHETWWFVYVAGIYIYTMLRALADELGLGVHVQYVIALEKQIFRGVVPTVEMQRDWFSPAGVGWLDLIASAIHASFFVVPHAVAVVIWHRGPRVFPRYVLAVLGTLYLGLALFFLVPTAPPWLAATRGALPGVYRVIDFVGQGIDVDTYMRLHETLAEPNSVAAVPSIHMALTFLLLLWAWRWFRPALPAVAIYNAGMAASLMYLGEHYGVDVIAGVMAAIAVDAAVHARRPRLRRKRAAIGAASTQDDHLEAPGPAG